MWPRTKPERMTPVAAMISFRAIAEVRRRERVVRARGCEAVEPGAAIAMIVR
jgi:hypothetical protein